MNKKEQKRKWYLKNREKILKEKKERLKKYKSDYYSVYLLEDYNYVGVTNQIYLRFQNHKSLYNRDCSNHRILYKTKSKTDARELELLLHDMGYEGKHPHFDWRNKMSKNEISKLYRKK